MAKPLPATVTELTVSAALPDEVNVSALVELVFSETLPKSILAALNVSFGLAICSPVPLSATVVVLPLPELLEIVMVPLAVPATVGSRLT